MNSESTPTNIGQYVLTSDVELLKAHIEHIRKQIESLASELTDHDLQAKTEFDNLKIDVGFLKGNIEKTQACLLEVNDVLDKMALLSNNNTRAVGAASEAVRDLATILSLNADKRESFYQEEISAKREADRDAARLAIEKDAAINKAKDARMIKWIAIITTVITIAGTILISAAEHLLG